MTSELSGLSAPRPPRSIVELFRLEAPDSFWRIGVFVGVAAASYAMLLAALAQILGAPPGASITRYAFLYALAFSLFLYAHRSAGVEITAMGEDAMASLRLALAAGLLSHDPDLRARAIQAQASGRLERGAEVFSRDLPQAAAAAQAATAAALTLCYIGVLSPAAFVLVGGGLGLSAVILRARLQAAAQAQLQAQGATEAARRAMDALNAAPPASPEERVALFEAVYDALCNEAAAKADIGRRRLEAGSLAAFAVLAFAPLAAFALPHATEAGAARLLIAGLFMAPQVIIVCDALPALGRLEDAAEDLLDLSYDIDPPEDEENQTADA